MQKDCELANATLSYIIAMKTDGADLIYWIPLFIAEASLRILIPRENVTQHSVLGEMFCRVLV